MNQDPEIDAELRQVLWACYEYWKGEAEISADERVLCYSWVERVYQKHFGTGFHQSKMGKLKSLGLLEEDGTSRGGDRTYYRFMNPSRIYEFLRGWQMV